MQMRLVVDIFSAMIEVMRVVDHVLVWLFGNDVISPNHP